MGRKKSAGKGLCDLYQPTSSEIDSSKEQSASEQIKCKVNASLKNAERNAVLQLERAYHKLIWLAEIRYANKLSVSRVRGVAKELRELIKILSVYNPQN